MKNLTINQGDSHEINSFFTYKTFGTSGIENIEYINISQGNTNIINTNTLEVGTHIIECIVTNTNGKSFSDTLLIIVNKKEEIEGGNNEEIEEKYVAKIGEKYYTTLQNAIDAVPTDNTETLVELLTNVSEDLNVLPNKNMILELHGNTVNNMAGTTIQTYGNLSIRNGIISSTNANSIYNEGKLNILDTTNIISNGESSIINKTTGDVTVDGGNISTIGEKTINNEGIITIHDGEIYSTNNWGIVNESNGKISIYGGIITTAEEKGISNEGNVLLYEGEINGGIGNMSGAELEIQGGTIDVINVNAIGNAGNLKIQGGNIKTQELPAIYNANTGITTITGGDIFSKNGNAINNLGTTNISGTPTITNNANLNSVISNTEGTMAIEGGTLTSTNSKIILNLSELEISESAQITKLTGSANDNQEAICNDVDANLTITGGNIITADDTAILNKGEMTINGDATIEVTNESEGYGIVNYPTGVLNVTNGNLETKSVAIGNMGQATLGGQLSIVCNSQKKAAIANDNGNLIINGGIITANTGNIINNEGNLEITGTANLVCNSTNNTPALVNQGEGILTINGGTITSQYADVIYNSANITITNGKIVNNSNENPALLNINSGEITITGGSITSTEVSIRNDNTGKITITGGTLTSENSHVIHNFANLEISQNANFISNNMIEGNVPVIVNNVNGNATITGGNFTSKHPTVIYNVADMAISGNINIITTSSNNVAIQNDETGKLTISAVVNFEGITNIIFNYGNLEMNEGTVLTAGGKGSPIVNYANATITGGTIDGKTTNAISNIGTLEITGMVNISAEGETIPTIYNFTSTSDIPTKLTIKAGNINSTKSMAVYAQEQVEIIISGTANLTNSLEGQPVVYSAGILMANGGTIKSGNTNAIFNTGTATINGTAYLETSGASYPTIYNKGTLTVDGGTIKNTASGGYAIYNNGGTSTVNGGSITGTVN